MKKIAIIVAIVLGSIMGIYPATTNAAANVQLTQAINPGVLTVSILDASEVTVPSPSFAMSTLSAATNCRPTGSTGSLGSSSQRIYVDNPGAADNGWSLSIAATSGPTAAWTSGSSSYDFNDQTTSGCGDGADADSLRGLLSVNPTTGTITAACDGICTNTGVTTSAGASFNEGTVDAVELVGAGASSDNMWRGYVTGVGLTQSIPAGQAPGSYAINMTATAVAL